MGAKICPAEATIIYAKKIIPDLGKGFLRLQGLDLRLDL